MLTASEREWIRRSVDQAKRRKLGVRGGGETWLSLPEAATLTGTKATKLRRQVAVLQIPVLRRGGRTLIQVKDLDRLRAEIDSLM